MAFEPDPDNRQTLEARVGRFGQRVHIDPRALGDEAREGVPFYASPESTGISGLTAFRDSHALRTEVERVRELLSVPVYIKSYAEALPVNVRCAIYNWNKQHLDTFTEKDDVILARFDAFKKFCFGIGVAAAGGN